MDTKKGVLAIRGRKFVNRGKKGVLITGTKIKYYFSRKKYFLTLALFYVGL
jgi:hypothetical protein